MKRSRGNCKVWDIWTEGGMIMKVEFEDLLWNRVKKYAETAGYSSAEEFVQHAVERQIDTASPAEDAKSAANKIKGLGYLDAGSDI